MLLVIIGSMKVCKLILLLIIFFLLIVISSNTYSQITLNFEGKFPPNMPGFKYVSLSEVTYETPEFIEPIQGPKVGIRNVLVVFTNFKDIKISASIKFIIDILRKVNEYFTEISYGKISLNYTILEKSITLPRNMDFYGSPPPNRGWDDDPERIKQLIVDVLNELLKLNTNINKYHTIIIIHAGSNEAYTRNPYDIWSKATAGEARIYIGNEILYISIAIISEFDGLNVYVHELLHCFGLPDLYDYEKRRVFVGFWDVLGEGSKLNPPPHPLAILKYYIDWISPGNVVTLRTLNNVIFLEYHNGTKLTILSRSVKLKIYAQEVKEDGIKLIVIPLNETHFIALELRLKIGFDKVLPSEGLLMTIVDITKSSGEGPIRVIDANPRTLTLNDAALGLGDVFTLNVSGIPHKITLSKCGLIWCEVVITLPTPLARNTIFVKYFKAEKNESYVNTQVKITLHAVWVDGEPARNIAITLSNGLKLLTNNEGIAYTYVTESSAGLKEYEIIEAIDIKSGRKLNILNVTSVKITWYELKILMNLSKTYLNTGDIVEIPIKVIKHYGIDELINASLVLVKTIKNPYGEINFKELVNVINGFAYINLSSTQPTYLTIKINYVIYRAEVINSSLLRAKLRVNGEVKECFLNELQPLTIVFDEVLIHDIKLSKHITSIGTPIRVSFKAKYALITYPLNEEDVFFVNGVKARFTDKGVYEVELISYEPTKLKINVSARTRLGITKVKFIKEPPEIIWDVIIVKINVLKERINLCDDVSKYLETDAYYEVMSEEFKGRITFHKPPCIIGKHLIRLARVVDEKYNITKYIVSNASIIYDQVIIKLSTPQNIYLVGSKPKVITNAFYAYDKKPLRGFVKLNLTSSLTKPGTYVIIVNELVDEKYGLKNYEFNPITVTITRPKVNIKFIEGFLKVALNINILYEVNERIVSNENITVIINDNVIKTNKGVINHAISALSPVITADIKIMNNDLLIYSKVITYVSKSTLMLYLGFIIIILVIVLTLVKGVRVY